MSIPSETHCIMVGTPCYGRQVTDLYAGSLLKLQMACAKRGVGFQVNLMGADALITRARQNIVATFLTNDKSTHLLFIDADIGFEPEQAFRLLDLDVDVAAAVYPIKRLDWQKIYACAENKRLPLESSAMSYMIEFSEDRTEVVNGFAKVHYAGTGFFLIKRHVLISMVERYAELRYAHDHKHEDKHAGSKWRSALFNCMIDQESGVYLSEDFSFCKRWTDMGGVIWADLHSRLTHVGAVNFTGDMSTQFRHVHAD